MNIIFFGNVIENLKGSIKNIVFRDLSCSGDVTPIFILYCIITSETVH